MTHNALLEGAACHRSLHTPVRSGNAIPSYLPVQEQPPVADLPSGGALLTIPLDTTRGHAIGAA